MAGHTPSQTVGPFFHLGMVRAGENELVPASAADRIRVGGRVLDGHGDPVPDALVEIWQANAQGRYHHPADARDDIPLDAAFRGAGRCATDAEGAYAFTTIKPGPVPGRDGQSQAPHVMIQVFARGMLIHCTTRCYFADEPATEQDAVLLTVPEGRRGTLIADLEGGDPPSYRFDIVLQGEGETVFFDV